VPDYKQPDGQMTVIELPEELRGSWDDPQEVELRIAGELVLYGKTTGFGFTHMLARCANPACDGGCEPTETLRVDIDIAPYE
jgi:hypothetical protein